MPGESVLVVDDSPTILKVVQLVLTKAGFRVTTAVDGEVGLDAAKQARPDMILLDFVMPKMNGYQVCRAIKSNEATKKIPVILLSAKGRSVDQKIGFENGADDYITKPFSPRKLIERVNALLAERDGKKQEEVA